MRTRVRCCSVLTSVLLGCLSLTLGGAAVASAPIKPHQHFVGIVNGRKASAAAAPVVYTVCAGPIWPGRTGPVAGGQTLAVARVAKGGGFTGPFSQVFAWFVQDSSPGGPRQITFRTYGTKVAIATTVRVPCGGYGQVAFSSCPHLAPCAAGWIPVQVTVRFENIAV